MIQNPRHELLFEIAMRQLCSGDSRGAVFNAASAAESFYLFFINVAFAARGLGITATRPKRWAWLHRSEQQAGGFAVAHAFLFNEPPSDAVLKLSNLRNEVVHAGQVPTQEEAEKHVRTVYEMIVPLVLKLRDAAGESFHKETSRLIIDAVGDRMAAGVSPVTCLIGTVICCIDNSALTRDFAASRALFEKYTLPRLQADQLSQLYRLLQPGDPA
ncbi:MAG TPA: hypothetical protein VFK05_19205 [Polyangiaceae bacterium]|nr:hypothetical protein [Polyangiaceae bacterium]